MKSRIERLAKGRRQAERVDQEHLLGGNRLPPPARATSKAMRPCQRTLDSDRCKREDVITPRTHPRPSTSA
jgi:hypothetical protein